MASSVPDDTQVDIVIKPKKPLWRRMIKWFFVTLGVLLLLVALTIGFFHTGPGKSIVRGLAEDKLNSLINGKATLGSIDYALFGDLQLKDLVITDADGKQFVRLGQLDVEPAWGDLIGGSIALDRLAIDGLDVDFVAYEDKSNTLSRLFKAPIKLDGKKPLELRDIDLRHINFHMTKFDGTDVRLADVTVRGKATVDKVNEKLDAEITELSAGLTFVKPGMKVTAPLALAFTAHRAGRVVDAVVKPVKTTIHLERDGQPTKDVPLLIGGMTVAAQERSASLKLDGIAAGPLTLAGMSAALKFGPEGQPEGEQALALTGLHVGHDALNELLGRSLLLSDVDADVTAKGTTDNLALTGDVRTDGGVLALRGTVDAHDPTMPSYDITLTGTDIASKKLVAGDGPDVTTSFTLTAKGKGIKMGAADADIVFDLGPTVVNGKTIDAVHLAAEARGAVMKLTDLTVTAFGQTLVVDGEMNRDTRRVQGSMKTTTGIAEAIAKAREAGVLIVPLPPLAGLLEVDLNFEATLKDKGAQAGEEPAPDTLPGTLPLDKLPIEAGRMWGHITGTDIQADARRVGKFSVEVDTTLEDKKPKGTVKFEVADLDTGTMHLDSAKIDLLLDGFDQDITIAVRDEAQKLAVDARAHTLVDMAKRHVTATLSQLDVKRGGAALSLAKPVVFEVDAPDPKGTEQTFTLPSTTLAVAGGMVTLGGRARFVKGDPEHPEAQQLANATMNVDLDGLSIGQLAALARKPTRGVSGRVSGHLSFDGTPADPSVGFGATITARAPTAAKSATIKLAGGIVDKRLSFDARVLGTGRAPIATMSVRAPLTIAPGKKPGLAPGGRLVVDLAVEKTRFSELAPILPAATAAKLDPSGTVEANAHLSGSPARPTGSWRLAVVGKLAPPGGPVTTAQRLEIAGSLTPDATGTALTNDLDLWLDKDGQKLVGLAVGGHFERSPLLPTRLDKPWDLHGNLATIDLATAGLPMPNAPKAGKVSASFRAEGAGQDVTGGLNFDALGVDAGGGKPITDLHYGVTLSDTALVLDIGAKANGLEALAVSGTIGVGGKGIRRLVKDRPRLMQAPLDVHVSVPKHTVAAWSALGPKRLTLPGDFGGDIAVTGTIAAPVANGAFAYDGFTTLAGGPGRVALELAGDASDIAVGLAVGAPVGGKAPLRAFAHVDPAQLAAFRGKTGPLDVRLEGGAEAVDLLTLVPGYAIGKGKLDISGVLDASLDSVIRLVPGQKRPDPAGTRIAGSLRLHDVALAVPNTTRAFHDVGLGAVASNDGLTFSLTAREDDMQKKDRAVDVAGKLGLAELRPTVAELHITTKDFLVMGKGFDGPEAELTATIDVEAKELLGPVREVTVTIPSLELNSPDRFVRAHYQQILSYTGDIVFLDEAGAVSGKIPGGAPPAVVDAGGAAPDAPSAPAGGVDIHLRIPNKIHALAHPLDLYVQGAMDVTMRGKELNLQGRLEVLDGAISVMGWWWPLVKGAITADGGLGTALVDLTFRQRPNDSALRDAKVEGTEHGGDTFLNVQLSAAKGQVLSFSGVAGPWLLDVATMLNTGRARIFSRADLPATANVQFGDPNQGLTNSFVQTNLTNLIFMDRANGWSEPIGNFDEYGRIWNFEAERVVPGTSQRVRFMTHKPGVARNRVELSYDVLFGRSPRSVMGAGARLGSDLRLGLGLFWEFYSE